MMNRKKQLEKIEGKLTPRQAYLLLHEEQQHFKSWEDYVRWLWSESCPARVQQALGKAIESIGNDLKNHSAEEIVRAKNKALREISFLDAIVSSVNAFAMDSRHLLDKLALLLEDGCWLPRP